MLQRFFFFANRYDLFSFIHLFLSLRFVFIYVFPIFSLLFLLSPSPPSFFPLLMIFLPSFASAFLPLSYPPLASSLVLVLHPYNYYLMFILPSLLSIPSSSFSCTPPYSLLSFYPHFTYLPFILLPINTTFSTFPPLFPFFLPPCTLILYIPRIAEEERKPVT